MNPSADRPHPAHAALRRARRWLALAGAVVEAAAQSIPAGAASAFRPLPQSAYALDARLALIRNARTSVDLQYYLVQDDAVGHTLLRALREAAQRGVRVRLLVDDLYTARSGRLLDGLAAQPHVEVRLFNPFPAGRGSTAARFAFSLLDFARVNHRMHNKMLLADGAFAVVGGRNIANEYFFGDERGNFIDFDLLVAGAALPRLAAVFDAYWNSPRSYPLQTLERDDRAPAQRSADFEAQTADAAATPPLPTAPDLLGYRPLSADLAQPPLALLAGPVDVYADDPEKVGGRSEGGDDRGTVVARVGARMLEARSELVIVSPYFIPGAAGMEAIRGLRERGVKVELVTNALASNDELLAGAAYARYRVPLLRSGVVIHEVDAPRLAKNPFLHGLLLRRSAGHLHTKLVVIDRRYVVVGSMNMDRRSSRLNTELGLVVDSPALAEQVLGMLEKITSGGGFEPRLDASGQRLQWVTHDEGAPPVSDVEPDVGALSWFKLMLLSPFVSESLL